MEKTNSSGSVLLDDGRVLFKTEDIQALFGVGKSTVEQWRLRGYGPKFIRLEGSRLIRYRRGDVLAYIESQTAVSSTTEADMLGEAS
jgi:predicted DNA-binding transcriptional regulator AlpA